MFVCRCTHEYNESITLVVVAQPCKRYHTFCYSHIKWKTSCCMTLVRSEHSAEIMCFLSWGWLGSHVCWGTHTPPYCPRLEYRYLFQGCATSEMLSSLYYYYYTLGAPNKPLAGVISCRWAVGMLRTLIPVVWTTCTCGTIYSIMHYVASYTVQTCLWMYM